MPRVRDWSWVVAPWHASLTEWHQHVLSLSSSRLPSTPQRVTDLGRCFQLPLPNPLRFPLTPAARHHSTLLSQEATLVVERRLLPRPRCSQQLLA